MRFVFFLLLTVLGSIGWSQTASNGLHRCGQDTVMGNHYRFCIDTTAGSKNTDILYYLHGRGEDETSWEGPKHASFRERLTSLGIDAPTVISISFGPGWLLTNLHMTHEKSLADVFVHGILPRTEALVPQPHGRRMLLGASMGGYNAALMLERNGHLFQRVALACPAISTLNPFSTSDEIEEFIAQHGDRVNPVAVRGMYGYSHTQFIDQKEWDANDPLGLTARLSSKSPPIYVSCGDHDDFGFYDGAREFVRRARKAGARVEWVSLSGGHCVTDVPSLAKFLTAR